MCWVMFLLMHYVPVNQNDVAKNVAANLHLCGELSLGYTTRKLNLHHNNCYSCRKIHCNCLVMDSGSSIMLIFNEDILENVSTMDDPTPIHAGVNNFKVNRLRSLNKPCDIYLCPKMVIISILMPWQTFFPLP